MTEYEIQAQNFLDDTGTTMQVEFIKYGKHFDNDKENRDIYRIIISKDTTKRKFIFNFGQSINASGKYIVINDFESDDFPVGWRVHDLNNINRLIRKAKRRKHNFYKENKDFSAPSAYNVLACLTKNDPEHFEEFCACFGYDTDSRRAEEVYHAVVDEWKNVCALWSDTEIELLSEIN